MGCTVPMPPPSLRAAYEALWSGDKPSRLELHDGAWFVQQGRESATEATTKFMVLVSIIAGVIAWAI